MKKPKRPKPLKLPKRPKASASVTTWGNYQKRCTAACKANKEREADYKRKVKKIEMDKKKKAQLMKKSSHSIYKY